MAKAMATAQELVAECLARTYKLHESDTPSVCNACSIIIFRLDSHHPSESFNVPTLIATLPVSKSESLAGWGETNDPSV